jgi:hypothetical protein
VADVANDLASTTTGIDACGKELRQVDFKGFFDGAVGFRHFEFICFLLSQVKFAGRRRLDYESMKGSHI